MPIISRICGKMFNDLAFHSVLSLLAAKAKRETRWVTKYSLFDTYLLTGCTIKFFSFLEGSSCLENQNQLSLT